MTTRREFLAGTLAAVAPRLPGVEAPVPRVEAVPTLFHGHPDGQTTLVRFVATGVDAPAARLRVLAPNGRLLGTAGLVRRGDVLAGELWLPLSRAVTVRSALESPVTRGVHRTSHPLAPTPRWTVHWLTLGEPETLRERFAGVPLLLRGAEAAILTAAGVRLNPWSAAPTGGRDHLDLLRVAVPAARLAAVTGLQLSARALVDDPERGPFLLEALATSGVDGTIEDDAGGDPVALGFDVGRARMSPRVEGWLEELGRVGDRGDRPTVSVVGTDAEFAVRARASIDEWNGLYAYPRIVVDEGDSRFPIPHSRLTRESGIGNGQWDPFDPLARLVSPTDPTLAGAARRFRFPTGGLLVFNPSPFGRSGAVELPGGGWRIVTDVPALGYALLPTGEGEGGEGGGTPPVRETVRPVSTERFAVWLDEERGAITSLVDHASGREVVAPGGALNAMDGTFVTDAWVERIAGVGVRLVARRMTTAGALTSKVTIYDALPWVDVENVPDADVAVAFDWRFDFAHDARETAREVAGGTVRAPLPVDRAAMLRWLALHGGADTLLFGSDAPVTVTVSDQAQVTAHTTRPAARFRVARHSGYLLPDDPWRFGFGMVPLGTAWAPGTGDLPLPTFGRLLDVADPAVAVVGLKAADDATGVIVYFMDLGGPARGVALRPGVLAFEGGLRTDLTERDREPAQALPGGGILVPITPGGYAAVRLLGVRVAT